MNRKPWNLRAIVFYFTDVGSCSCSFICTGAVESFRHCIRSYGRGIDRCQRLCQGKTDLGNLNQYRWSLHLERCSRRRDANLQLCWLCGSGNSGEGTKTLLMRCCMRIRNSLDEVVVVGYGSLSRREVSSSIVQVNKSDFQTGAMNNPMEMLTGKVTGLNVSTTAAANPNGSSALQVRGATSLSAGNMVRS